MAYYREPFTWKNTPWRQIYLAYALLKLAVLHVYWLLKYALPQMRPHPSWPLARCFGVERFRFMVDTMHEIRGLSELIHTPNSRRLEPGEGFLGVWVRGVPDMIVDSIREWADAVGVEACDIPGYWSPKPGSGVPDESLDRKPFRGEKVLYHLHAGCYTFWSAHPKHCEPEGELVRNLLRYAPANVTRAFAIEHRRCSAPPCTARNPFPAPLLDAIAGYNYLVNVAGIAPSDIIVSGDSAGGHLALAFARYLQDNAIPSLPMFGGLLLLSPHCDLDMYPSSPESSLAKNIKTDITHQVYFRPKTGYDVWQIQAILGPLAHDRSIIKTNAYLSPAPELIPGSESKISFHGFPRTFLISGELEIWIDQIRRLRDSLLSQIGKQHLTYHESENSVHAYMVFDWHEPQRSETMQRIGSWLSEF